MLQEQVFLKVGFGTFPGLFFKDLLFLHLEITLLFKYVPWIKVTWYICKGI